VHRGDSPAESLITQCSLADFVLCVCRNISRDRGLRAVLEATGSVAVLFYLSWRLAPVLGAVIVGTGVAAAMYRNATRGIEARMAYALRCLSRVAGQAFRNVNTVRAFAGACLADGRACHARNSNPGASASCVLLLAAVLQTGDQAAVVDPALAMVCD
jgi:ABC-type multidrug transport system fused ATPase/permease subunit